MLCIECKVSDSELKKESESKDTYKKEEKPHYSDKGGHKQREEANKGKGK